MKIIKTANFNKLSSIDSVVQLVRKGLSISTAIEQIYGLGKATPQLIKEVKNKIGNRIPIKSI